jgi:hypothetical protein
VRLDFIARLDALKPIHDDSLARLQSVRYDAQPVMHVTQNDAAVLNAVVLVDDEHELLILVSAHSGVVYQQCWMWCAAADLYPGI